MRSNREIVLAAVRRQGKVVAGKCTSYKSHVKHAALQNGTEECSENAASDILNLEQRISPKNAWAVNIPFVAV